MLQLNTCSEKKGNVYGGASSNAMMIAEESGKQRNGRVGRTSLGCCITIRYVEWDRWALPRLEQTEIMALLEFISEDQAGLMSTFNSPTDPRLGQRSRKQQSWQG